MNKVLLGLMAAMVAAPALAKDAPVVKAEKPTAEPGWVVIEEDLFYPFRYEPLESLNSIRYHYRRNQETAAANEIDKAISWLKFAEGHALPITKAKLTVASDGLKMLSKDLRAGNVVKAATLDSALAKCSQALSEWHFYKSKESWGKSETQDAGHDLELAAQYLQNAANSAHYQFGADTTKVITSIYDHGKLKSESTHYDHNTLGQNLQAIEKALENLSKVMKK